MENTSRDILFQMGIELDLPDLLNLCQSNNQINSKLCQQNAIWNYKLESDFGDYLDWNEYPKFKPIYEKSKREYYTFLYGLNKIKTAWKLKSNLYEIYYLPELHLNQKLIEEIPKEICQLHNLQYLYLPDNNIKSIPKEIGQLKKLQGLFLQDNKIENIPKEIGQLHNLKLLYLSRNPIEDKE